MALLIVLKFRRRPNCASLNCESQQYTATLLDNDLVVTEGIITKLCHTVHLHTNTGISSFSSHSDPALCVWMAHNAVITKCSPSYLVINYVHIISIPSVDFLLQCKFPSAVFCTQMNWNCSETVHVSCHKNSYFIWSGEWQGNLLMVHR